MNAINTGYIMIVTMWLLTIAALLKYFDLLPPRPRRLSLNLRDWPYIAAAVSPPVVRECPKSDQVWFGALGITMLLLGVLAAVGMGLSVYQFTSSLPLAFLAGSFWGGLIVAVDRLLVAAMDKFEAAWKSWLKAVPRVGMILALGIIISHTIIQWMFASDINRVLLEDKQAMVSRLNNDSLEAQKTLQNRIAEINQQLTPLDKELADLNQRYAREVLGDKGAEFSGQSGIGPVAQAVQKAIDDANARKRALLEEKTQLEKAIKETQQEILQNNQKNKATLEAPAGMLDRARAVDTLCEKNPQARLIYWAMLLALLLIESIPIMSKLLGAPREYDYRIRQRAIQNEAHLKMFAAQQTAKADCMQNLLREIYRRFATGDLHDKDFRSPLMNQLWQDMEQNMKHGYSSSAQAGSSAEEECAVTVYLAEPGNTAESNRVVLNFGLPKTEVLGAHLVKALGQIAVREGLDKSHWLQPDYFELFNVHRVAIKRDQPLFPQLENDTVWAVPVLK